MSLFMDVDVLNVNVLENVPTGYNVTTISASDPDGPSDGEVVYEFEGNASVSKQLYQLPL